MTRPLAPVSTMKPIVANPKTTFDDLIDGIDALETDGARKNQIDMIIAKVLRNKNKMSDKNREQFASLCGGVSPEEFIKDLRKEPIDKAVETVKKHRDAFKYIHAEYHERPVFISNEQDELTSHERSYGGATKPEDYLKEFHSLNFFFSRDICFSVDVDYDEALKWCKLGAEQGNTHGEYNYGLMFENGYGVERDIEEARYWYTKAADQGNNDAIEGLKRLENY